MVDECGYCGDVNWCESRANGKPQCLACKAERFFDAVLYRPIGFALLPWQRKIVRGLFGTVELDGGLRRYRRAYVSVAKKNGKSFLVGGFPLYHLLMENEIRPEAYGAAAAKDQASIVFRAAAELVRRNPILSNRLAVHSSVKRITRKDGGGFYSVISADGDLQDGIEPSLALVDELHRWKTAKAETLYQVLTKGTISRKQPLTIEITTAGEVHDSKLCYREHEFAEQVLAGAVESKRFYPVIYQADQAREKVDPEYWKTREARVAANPSHEDCGGFLKDEAIREELDKAVNVPAERQNYLRYHLNLWVSSESRYIPADAWARCGQLVQQPLIDRECIAGLDLSITTDLTALVLLFPDGEFVDVLPFFWMPGDVVHERQRKDRVPYATWVQQGMITVTEGRTVNYDAVKEKLDWARSMFRLSEVAYDPWNAHQFTRELTDDGYMCIEVRQTMNMLSDATKWVLSKVLNGQFRHGNHPVLNWMADCASVKGDGKDNYMLSKPDRGTSGKRIDGISAAVTAASAKLRKEAAGQSIFSLM